jgi:hypothetical protein
LVACHLGGLRRGFRACPLFRPGKRALDHGAGAPGVVVAQPSLNQPADRLRARGAVALLVVINSSWRASPKAGPPWLGFQLVVPEREKSH